MCGPSGIISDQQEQEVISGAKLQNRLHRRVSFARAQKLVKISKNCVLSFLNPTPPPPLYFSRYVPDKSAIMVKMRLHTEDKNQFVSHLPNSYNLPNLSFSLTSCLPDSNSLESFPTSFSKTDS